jgi:hypothetical protein
LGEVDDNKREVMESLVSLLYKMAEVLETARERFGCSTYVESVVLKDDLEGVSDDAWEA